jgi:hypothetical protein
MWQQQPFLQVDTSDCLLSRYWQCQCCRSAPAEYPARYMRADGQLCYDATIP